MNKKIKSELIEWIKTLATALVLALAITCVVQPTMVSGQSMYPTLENNDYLFINKLAYQMESPKRGDIIVFKTKLLDNKSYKNKKLVKRVIALPGENLVIKDGEVYVDGKLLNENYINGVDTLGDIDIVVPKNSLFVMGDNRDKSMDSRSSDIGTVSMDDIVGKVSLRVYPFDKLGSVD